MTVLRQVTACGHANRGLGPELRTWIAQRIEAESVLSCPSDAFCALSTPACFQLTTCIEVFNCPLGTRRACIRLAQEFDENEIPK
jgi:hypothetical protein